tara:strand:+ start:897 stop:2057 length:1161 start_codon:yes stop_codon:yes gene_type:complete
MVKVNTELTKTDTPTSTGSIKQFRISGDVIRETMKLVPADQAQALWWFSNYARDRNLGQTQLGSLLKKPNGQYYTYNTISQALTGKRTREGSSIELLVEAIIKIKEIEELRESQQSVGYIHTRLSDEIWKRCEKALLRNRITFIFGDSQIGKTEALKEYQKQHNHGETIYIEMPTSANLGSFLAELAIKLGIPENLKQSDLKRRIINAFDNNMLLIVDEAHRCFSSRYGMSGLVVFDFLRELWNKQKTGIVISLTNEGRDHFQKGPHAKKLEQLWRRRITPLQLPPYPPEDDLALFASSFGLPPATDTPIKVSMDVIDDQGNAKKKTHTNNPLKLQTDQVEKEGLGVWISILEDAADMASEANRELTWGAVIKAYCLSQAEAEMIQ